MSKKISNKQIIGLVFTQLKHNRLQATNNVVAGLVIVALEFLFVWLTKQTIDVATGVSHRFTLTTVSTYMVLTMVAQLLVSAYRSWVNSMLSARATNKMQADMFRHSLLVPWHELKAYHSGDIVNRIEKDVSTIVHLVTDTLPAFVTVCVQFIGAFCFLYLMDSTLALFVVIVIPFFVLLGKLYVKKMRQLSRQIRQADSQLQAQYQEGIANRIVIKTIHGAMLVVLQRVLHTQEHIVALIRTRARYSIGSNTVMNIGFASAYLFTFLWGTHRLADGLITYGALMAFVQLVGQIQRPARSLVKFIPEVINSLTSGERILEVQTLQQEPVTPQPPVPIVKGSWGLRVRNLTFGYTPERDILRNLTFDFPPSSCTAIMGPTGQGKTTLVRLMLSLLAPRQGSVELYDSAHTLHADTSTRSMFAYVPQGNTLFSGTIRDNLKIASPHATDSELHQALRMAKADFVFTLPEGLASPCGEHGVSLSEGQAQRLCIARALLLNAPILLLDEATSALDADTEAQVLHNICTQLSDKTVICISHRPKVLQYCTQVLKLEE